MSILDLDLRDILKGWEVEMRVSFWMMFWIS